MKSALTRLILAALLIAGFVFEQRYFLNSQDILPNEAHFDSYVDIRGWNESQVLLLGEWITTSVTNAAIIIRRETVIHGPFGNAIWLPGPAWAGALVVNGYFVMALVLARLLLRDFARWRGRKGRI